MSSTSKEQGGSWQLALPAPPDAPRADEAAPAAEVGLQLSFPAQQDLPEEVRGSEVAVSSAGSDATKTMRASAGRLAAVTASLQIANADQKEKKKEEKKKEKEAKKKEKEEKKNEKVEKAKSPIKKKKQAKKAEPAETKPAASAPAVKTDSKRSVKRPIPGPDVKEQMRTGSPRTKVSLHMKWGCTKCVFKPDCTPSCWKQRKQQKPE